MYNRKSHYIEAIYKCCLRLNYSKYIYIIMIIIIIIIIIIMIMIIINIIVIIIIISLIFIIKKFFFKKKLELKVWVLKSVDPQLSDTPKLLPPHWGM